MNLAGNRRPELYGLLTAARALPQQTENA